MADLTDRILAAALAPPADAALDVMRLSLVDWLAVGLAGVDEPVAQVTRQMVLEEGGAGMATLFGGPRVPMRAAALANGAASHALDYDDTHFAHIGHPSVAVIPAALAVAEHVGASKSGLLCAALAGCEASIRVGLALGRGHYQVGFHQTATAGAFGATVAAARLMGATDSAMAQALGLVSTRASGLKSQFGTMGKPYNAGIAAANGVEAAYLASHGFNSNPGAVDGPLGFFATHHADGAADDRPGFLMESVSHKFHACCHGLHAALEALETLKPVEVATIEAVEVVTHPRWMSVCNQPAPRTGLEAKFSYKAVMALSLLGYKTAALDTFEDGLVGSGPVTALQDKVHVREDAALSETAAKLTLVTAGQAREARFDLALPQSLAQKTARMRTKVVALHGQARADALWQAVHGVDDSITAITACLS